MSTTGAFEILIVEDNPLDLEMTMRGLHKANIANTIHVARDGAEALEFLFCEGAHAHRRMEDAPRFVLLDLKLPKVDGLEVLARMKADERTRAIPVVMLTSSKEQRDLVESYLKRVLGTKDSAQTFGEMGGFLDVMDALLLAALPAYLWVELLVARGG